MKMWQLFILLVAIFYATCPGVGEMEHLIPALLFSIVGLASMYADV